MTDCPSEAAQTTVVIVWDQQPGPGSSCSIAVTDHGTDNCPLLEGDSVHIDGGWCGPEPNHSRSQAPFVKKQLSLATKPVSHLPPHFPQRLCAHSMPDPRGVSPRERARLCSHSLHHFYFILKKFL